MNLQWKNFWEKINRRFMTIQTGKNNSRMQLNKNKFDIFVSLLDR